MASSPLLLATLIVVEADDGSARSASVVESVAMGTDHDGVKPYTAGADPILTTSVEPPFLALVWAVPEPSGEAPPRFQRTEQSLPCGCALAF